MAQFHQVYPRTREKENMAMHGRCQWNQLDPFCRLIFKVRCYILDLNININGHGLGHIMFTGVTWPGKKHGEGRCPGMGDGKLVHTNIQHRINNAKSTLYTLNSAPASEGCFPKCQKFISTKCDIKSLLISNFIPYDEIQKGSGRWLIVTNQRKVRVRLSKNKGQSI